MTFANFCQANGLIIRVIRATGTIQRCATQCAPTERKGWYIYNGGNSGTCGIWHGLENNAQTWKPGADVKPLSPAEFARIAATLAAAEAEKRRAQYNAAQRAQALLKSSEMRSHAYLARKGFPELLAPCLDDGQMLLVTMWKGGKVVNLQRISESGEKRFLGGGEVLGTAHTIGSVGTAINCEGYCTGVSVAAAIKASKMRAHCVIWFTAGNMAANARSGVVVGDNDDLKTSAGLKAAKETGLPYYIPDIPGWDFNDLHRGKGLFAASQRIRELLLIR